MTAPLARRLVLAAVLLVLAGCGGTSADGRTAAGGSATPAVTPSGTGTSGSSGPTVGRYVALGDSYTAAPYVYLTAVAGGCLRSDANYPARLTKLVHPAKLVDVSCSGATTADLTSGQRGIDGRLAPQLDAVTADTDVVTLGIGGNDFGLFATLQRGCPVVGPQGNRIDTGSGRCGAVDEPLARDRIAEVGQRVRRALAEVHRRAPHATVVLVGYPRLAQSGRTCAALPISRTDATVVDRVTRVLSSTMAAAARSTRSQFVDLYTASRGHDACAGRRAWVNGVVTDTERAAALHPFAVEQQAVADRIARLLER